MYGTFAGTWYLAPGSKSSAVRATGGATPWYFSRNCHHASLNFSGVISPENTFHRHWSISRPKGRNATFSSARCSSRPMSFEVSGAFSSSPIFTRYSGVTESAMVSPTASWKPSLALSRNRYGSVL